jgi:hypothetical protein
MKHGWNTDRSGSLRVAESGIPDFHSGIYPCSIRVSSVANIGKLNSAQDLRDPQSAINSAVQVARTSDLVIASRVGQVRRAAGLS